MKDSCSSISKLLEKYFDREATHEERSFVEDHLLVCPACQDALKSMEGVGHLIKSTIDEATQKEDFPWVWQKIRREIQQKERPSWLDWFRSRFDLSPLFRKRIWMPAVAAMIILILITAQLFFKKTPSSPDLSVVEFTESQTYNVMVYESEKSPVTVIWLFEGPEMEPPAS